MDDEDTEEVEKEPERFYPWTNLKDLDFPHISDGPPEEMPNGSKPPAVLNYFANSMRYCSMAVLEESIVNNDCIKHTHLFKSLNPVFVDALLQEEGSIRAIVYMPDQLLARPCEPSRSLVIVIRGEVEITVPDCPEQSRRLRDGDVLGERQFFGGIAQRDFLAVAATFCDTRVIYPEALDKLLERIPEARNALPPVGAAWATKPERQALRATRVFTELCATCLQPSSDEEVNSLASTPRNMRGSGPLSQAAGSLVNSRTKGRLGKTGLRTGRGPRGTNATLPLSDSLTKTGQAILGRVR